MRHGNNASIGALELRLVVGRHKSLVSDMRVHVLACKFEGPSTSEEY